MTPLSGVPARATDAPTVPVTAAVVARPVPIATRKPRFAFLPDCLANLVPFCLLRVLEKCSLLSRTTVSPQANKGPPCRGPSFMAMRLAYTYGIICSDATPWDNRCEAWRSADGSSAS